MSMKYFTLSAVCTLVFCMLIALSGTTDFPEDRAEWIRAYRTTNATKIHGSDAPGAPPAARALMDWSEQGDVVQEGVGGVGDADQGRQVKLFGVLFILGWVFLSVRLLSSKDWD